MWSKLDRFMDLPRQTGRLERTTLSTVAVPLVALGRVAGWLLAGGMAIKLVADIGNPVVARGFLSAALMCALFEAAWWWFRPAWREIVRGVLVLCCLGIVAAGAAYFVDDLTTLTGPML